MIYPFLLRYVNCSPEKFPNISPSVREKLSKETGWERIQRMYSTDSEFGISPELDYITTTGTYMLVATAFFGGFNSMITARNDFFRTNMATRWESQHLARRNLADSLSLALFKGAAKSALKYGSFSTLYLLSTMTAANYRNKISVWDHVACAAVLGAGARINYGLKGFVVAGALGCFLGLVAGGLIQLTFRLNGISVEEARYRLHEEHYSRLKKDKLDELKEVQS